LSALAFFCFYGQETFSENKGPQGEKERKKKKNKGQQKLWVGVKIVKMSTQNKQGRRRDLPLACFKFTSTARTVAHISSVCALG